MSTAADSVRPVAYAALALTLAVFPDTALRAQAGDSLAVAIGRALSEEGLVGATWALVYPMHTSLGAAGLKDVSRGTPMAAHDRVHVGSVAKTFTAVGVLRLVTEGRVALDAPVTQYIPDIPLEWIGAVWGVVGMLYVLVAGGVRAVRAVRLGTWRSEPLQLPALCLALMVVAPLLYLTQSFLALGDPTPANLALAFLTGALPITLALGMVQRVRGGSAHEQRASISWRSAERSSGA